MIAVGIRDFFSRNSVCEDLSTRGTLTPIRLLQPCIILSTAHKSWWHLLASFATTSVFVTSNSAPYTILFACFPLLSAFLISYLIGSLSCCVSFLAPMWKGWPFIYTTIKPEDFFPPAGELINHSSSTITFTSLVLLNSLIQNAQISVSFLQDTYFFSFCIWHLSCCLNTTLDNWGYAVLYKAQLLEVTFPSSHTW